MDKITELERRNLEVVGNLSDAQVYIPLNKSQLSCIPDATFFASPRSLFSTQEEKHLFMRAFSEFHGGIVMPSAVEIMFNYSAAMATEIVLNVLRGLGLSRMLMLHPTYDASCYASMRHGMKLIPIDERVAFGSNIPWETLNVPDAIFLTLPNNPTGTTMSEAAFVALCRNCARDGVYLILDCCFRAYESSPIDYYSIVQRSGVNASIIEDTGKLFNLKDIKVGLLWVCGDWRSKAWNIHRDFLLEVPLFNLVALRKMLQISNSEYRHLLCATIQDNREFAIECMNGCGWVPIGGDESNVQLFKVPKGLGAKRVASIARESAVGIVEADGYFWADRPEDAYVRLALARTREEFQKLVTTLRLAIQAAMTLA